MMKHAQEIVIPVEATRYELWLSCGHSGGVAEAGSVATRRKCRECRIEGHKRVVRVEPIHGDR